MSQETGRDGTLMSHTVSGMRREELFSAPATVYILENGEWRTKFEGIVEFVIDLNTHSLRLITSPGTVDEMDHRLRPRIQSNGLRGYVVRSQAPNNGHDLTLGVRFERVDASLNFRQFVEHLRNVMSLNTEEKM